MLTDDVDGLLVREGQPAVLAEAYVRLARSPGDRVRLGASAALRAEAFDIARTARIVEARYRSLTRP